MSPPSDHSELRVLGATLHGFARACMDLNIVSGRAPMSLLREVEVDRWYPFGELRTLEDLVTGTYARSAVILERVGMEMMASWYRPGRGHQLIEGGVDFLHYQTGSRGYASVVQGPPPLVGEFNLVELDRERRRATIHSTTPFNKDLERGVIIGGMAAPGDLDLIEVRNDPNPRVFAIEF